MAAPQSSQNAPIPLRDLALFPMRAVIALALAFALLLLASAAQDAALFAGLLRARVWMLDVNSEDSAYTWASSLMIAVNAAVLFLLALADRAHRLAWAGLAILFVLGSADEILTLHEHLSQALLDSHLTPHGGAFYFPWVIAALAFVALMAAVFARFLWTLPRATAFLFLLAGAIYVVGAVGFEMIEAPMFEAAGDVETPLRRAMVTLEEGLEAAGQILFFYALLRHVADLARAWRVTFYWPGRSAG